jgi:transcriptional regulator of acetoin/glycerol metabolism
MKDIAGTAGTPLLSGWERFVRTGQLDVDALRPEIAQSWLRCRKAGTDPFQGRSRRRLDPMELARLLEKHKALIDVARPFMGNLYQFVASSSFVVLLCDSCAVPGYVEFEM